MGYEITLEAAVPVYAVESADEAVSVAITRLGEGLNPDMSQADMEKVERGCPIVSSLSTRHWSPPTRGWWHSNYR